MDQISKAIMELDSTTQQNAALVEETASASEEMSNQAQELLALMGTFSIRRDIVHAKSGGGIHLKINADAEKKKTAKPVNAEKSKFKSLFKKNEDSKTGGIEKTGVKPDEKNTPVMPAEKKSTDTADEATVKKQPADRVSTMLRDDGFEKF